MFQDIAHRDRGNGPDSHDGDIYPNHETNHIVKFFRMPC